MSVVCRVVVWLAVATVWLWGLVPAAQAASLGMRWDYTPNSHVATHFKVYRQEQCVGAFVLLATVPATQLTYTDGSVVYTKLYCWHVTTFDAVSQEESASSNVLRFQMPVEPLAVPENVRLQ